MLSVSRNQSNKVHVAKLCKVGFGLFKTYFCETVILLTLCVCKQLSNKISLQDIHLKLKFRADHQYLKLTPDEIQGTEISYIIYTILNSYEGRDFELTYICPVSQGTSILLQQFSFSCFAIHVFPIKSSKKLDWKSVYTSTVKDLSHQ